MSKKPRIVEQKEVARTRIFRVEELSLEFSNGQERIYERMVSGGSGAVMIVPVTEDKQLLLIREYSAGTEDYQLAFPKGLVEGTESIFEAANREIKEEIGFGANDFHALKKVSLAPGYFTHQMNIVLARDLYTEKLEGDEPEPLEVVYWPLDEINSLLEQEDFTEARSIAALFLAEKYLTELN
ncbi:ADP compounds hydrolase NudE [Aliikangiella marina]|uniref:ADP compounds hydrolase NudE n=1 Tax=Aliikangiella marina TaxID=1712262 RepID=A0A545T9N3_9GAMM|nr:ADP compounds hydrolase NudE [Aliikangiella marina]TQV73930.1 ADP compounds hydrolase NudE [Aliikangiella marina]